MKYLFRIIFLAINLPLSAQWQTDVRLTNDPATSFTTVNSAWAMASSINSLHVVWQDNRFGSYNIFYKRSTDGGASWGTDTRLTTASVGRGGAISASGQVLHVVWFDERDGNREIYYKRSTDEGNSWGNDIRLTNNVALSEYPCVAVSGQNIHAVWRDKRDGNYEIYYIKSTNNGNTWSNEIRLTNDSFESIHSCIAISNQNIHVVWSDSRQTSNKVFYKKSIDNGENWTNDTALSSGVLGSRDPCIAVSGQNIAVVWDDYRNGVSLGGPEIFYKRSTDGGASWGVDTRLTFDSLSSEDPSVAISGQNIHITWWENRDGNFEIYYKKSSNGGLNWDTDIRLTNSLGSSEAPTIITTGDFVHVVWYDRRDDNFEIYTKRNPTGNLTGIQNINNEIPKSYKLIQNYPNPFNPTTKIQFSVPYKSRISLKIQDITGKTIESLLKNEEVQAGTFEYSFDGTGLASGIYFYSLYSGQILIDAKKMILLK